MPEMTHGGDVYSPRHAGTVDFSANINPLGLPAGVKKAIENAVGECHKYPDPLCRGLLKALSLYESVPQRYIFASNGASEIIYRIVWAFRPRRVLLAAPTFSEYAQAAKTVGAEIRHVALDQASGFALGEDFIRQIEPGVDMVFVCNPNNPTGLPVPAERIQKIAQRCGTIGALLVVDECFMDFAEDGQSLYSAKSFLPFFQNLVILRAFTKIFAMPGVRLGYCMTSNASIIERLYHCGQPWSVSCFAQAAGCAAATEAAFVARSREYVEQEREYLKQALTSSGLRVFEGKANYLLFRADGRTDLQERLLDKGFLIRSCANYRGLDSTYYRVAVRTHDENTALIRAMGEEL